MQGVEPCHFEWRDPLAGVTEGDDDGLDMAFRVIDLTASDWLEAVRSSGCDAFVAWPDAFSTPVAKVVEDRLDLLETRRKRSRVGAAGSRGMAVDAFDFADGRPLVNELQTVFRHQHVGGPDVRRRPVGPDDSRPGWRMSLRARRLRRDACANARVLDVLAEGSW